MPSKVDKVIVTNRRALQAKYDDGGSKKIEAAIKNLITADKERGLTATLIYIDDAAQMKALKGLAVTKAGDPQQNKRAIDGIYHAVTPDYILILGAADVVPHQDLKNPAHSNNDPDEFAYGDLPYACEASYSHDPKDFFGPTRVVGRLPDLTSGKDPQYLLGLLQTAATYKTPALTDYQRFFGISAQVWEDSTNLSLRTTFGGGARGKIVPRSSAK